MTNTNFEKIRDLIVSEEPRDLWALPVTVLISKINYDKEKDPNLEDTKQLIIKKIEGKNFTNQQGRSYREGFLNTKTEKNKIETVFCKEVPFRIDFVPTGENDIESLRIRSINPRNKIKVIILLKAGEIEIRLFGGEENLAFNVRNHIQQIIRECLFQFSTLDVEFSREQMLHIFTNFRENVGFINIDPRDNLNFKKGIQNINSNGNEIKDRELLIYEVEALKMKGYKIPISPGVRAILAESNIYIREILGKLHLGGKNYITTKVNWSGRVMFYIPSNVVNLHGDEVFDFAINLFDRLINYPFKKTGQRTL